MTKEQIKKLIEAQNKHLKDSMRLTAGDESNYETVVIKQGWLYIPNYGVIMGDDIEHPIDPATFFHQEPEA